MISTGTSKLFIKGGKWGVSKFKVNTPLPPPLDVYRFIKSQQQNGKSTKKNVLTVVFVVGAGVVGVEVEFVDELGVVNGVEVGVGVVVVAGVVLGEVGTSTYIISL